MTNADLSAASLPQMPDSAYARIETFVAAGQLDAAMKALRVSASGHHEMRSAAAVLSNRLADATQERDLYGKDVGPERAQIADGILKLARKLVEVAAGEVECAAEPGGRVMQPREDVAAAPVSSVRRLILHKPIEHARREFRPAQPRVEEGTVFACDGLSKRYSWREPVLRDISFQVRLGELVGVVGENGSGKSTLLQIVAGCIPHSGGTIDYHVAGAHSWADLRWQIAYVPQHPRKWTLPVNLRTHLYLTATQHSRPGDDDKLEVEFWLHRLGLERYVDAKWDELSGGYKSRFELARAMIKRPALLVLDEPLAPLDIRAQRQFIQDLRDLAGTGPHKLPIIVTSQHIQEIEWVADRMLLLQDGRLEYSGPPAEFSVSRGGKLYELVCDASAQILVDSIAALGTFAIKESGRRFLLQTHDPVEPTQLLARLCDRGLVVRYFHDLSGSTRRIFEEGESE